MGRNDYWTEHLPLNFLEAFAPQNVKIESDLIRIGARGGAGFETYNQWTLDGI